MVNVFMASGHMGRTVFSCDDGLNWIHDKSQDDSVRCWGSAGTKSVECDHTPYSGRGLDSGDGWFFANFGWGYNGSLRRTRDGINWETIKTGDWGGGVSYSNGVLSLLWGTGFLSADLGMTWLPQSSNTISSLSYPQALRIDDKFFALGRANPAGVIAISYNQGQSWVLPPSIQDASVRNIAAGAGKMVAIGYTSLPNGSSANFALVSLDNGMSWTSQQNVSVGEGWSELVFDGEKFVAFDRTKRWTSVDGLRWTSVSLSIEDSGLFVGHIRLNPITRTYIHITNAWDNFYERQNAYRSVDGINWTKAKSFIGGHPVTHVVLGTMQKEFCK
jgi:hypothetical protein